MSKVKYLVALFLLMSVSAQSQKGADTAALLKEFNKVMAFTSQPYLYYATITRMMADPIIESQDTLTMKGEFYKSNTEIYSNDGRSEMYLQDSLMIEVNNDRKAIWVRKVDVATKANLNLLPVSSKEIIEQFKKSYNISKLSVSEDVSRLNFVEKKPQFSTSATTTFIAVEYSEKTWLPKSIEITIELKQPASEEAIEAIKAEGLDEAALIKTINGEKQLVRSQKVSIVFTTIDNDKEKLAKMPSYQSNLGYDAATADFKGKGKYRDYEVTKTF